MNFLNPSHLQFVSIYINLSHYNSTIKFCPKKLHFFFNQPNLYEEKYHSRKHEMKIAFRVF